jgi:phage repressor protein C with HTH and peptisase S24 domain
VRKVRSAMPLKGRPPETVPGAGQVEFTERLQALVRNWPSSDSLAKAAGVSPSALRKWLKGQAEPSRERLVALADAAGVAIGWLAKGDGPVPDLPAHDSTVPARGAGPGKRVDHEGFLVLPQHPEAAAAGAGAPAPPALVTEFIAFRHDWVRATFGRAPGDLILETAVGDSMEPHIRDGDHLLVDVTEDKFTSFGIYVMEMRGERIVKRVQRLFNGTLILISDNRIYQPEEIPAKDVGEVRVLGRVVWRGGRV